MTSFVDDSGNYLDYSGDDFGMTKQAASWYNFQIKGDISVDFKLPNTSNNRKALGYYGPSQIDSPAFTSTTWSVIRDGNKILRGSFVIKGSDDTNINAFFVSGNSNWFQLLQFSLKEIDFADRFNVLIDSADTQKSNTEGIIFPLVDWWAKGQHRSSVFTQGINQTQEEGPVFSEWHPCVYLHTIITEMANYSGVKITGTLTTDKIFRSIILTPTGPDLFWPDWVINESKSTVNHVSMGASSYAPGSDPNLVQWGTVTEAPQLNCFNASTYSFVAPRTASYQFDMRLDFSPSAATYRIDLYLDGVLDAAVYNGGDVDNVTFYKSLTRGQSVQFYVTRTTGATNYRILSASRLSIKIIKSVGTFLPSTYYTTAGEIPYVSPMAIVPDIKGVDLIKFLGMYFACAVTYDEYSKTLTLNKLSRFQKENAEDWSDYLVSYSVNYQTGAAQHNYIQLKGGEEDQIAAYNEQSKKTYGGGDIETSFDAVFEKDLYQAPFSISWDQVNISNNGLFLPYVKFYELSFEEEVAYSGVTNTADLAGNAAATFTSTFNSDINVNSVFFIKSDTGIYTGWTICRGSSTSTTNPISGITYSANDTGRIVKYSVGKVNSNSRILLVKPGANISDAGGGTIYYYMANNNSYSSATTAALAWSDKPQLSAQELDKIFDSLAIDSVNGRTYNHTIGERYHGPIENAFNNPKIDAMLRLPVKVFNAFNFGSYIYLEARNLKGYFWVNKIDGYNDPETAVKVELLYVD